MSSSSIQQRNAERSGQLSRGGPDTEHLNGERMIGAGVKSRSPMNEQQGENDRGKVEDLMPGGPWR